MVKGDGVRFADGLNTPAGGVYFFTLHFYFTVNCPLNPSPFTLYHSPTVHSSALHWFVQQYQRINGNVKVNSVLPCKLVTEIFSP